MFAFSTAPRARLLCRADFAIDAVLNIDFLNPADGTIPFHLSLRRDEGLVVVNRRHATGWRREIGLPVALGTDPVTIEVDFTPFRARVRLDGRLLGRFDALPRPSRQGRLGLRHGFPGLGRIGQVRLQGALEPGSLRMICPGLPPPAPGLELTDALDLSVQGLPETLLAPALHAPALRAPVRIEAPGLIPPLLAPVQALPHAAPGGAARRAALASLPGRLWAEGAEAVTFQALTADGASLGSLRLTRDDLARRVQRAARAGLWQADPLAALQAIETVRHARLIATLPADVAAQLMAAARVYGLQSWLLEDAAPATTEPAPPPAPPTPDLHEAARVRILARVRNEGADPVDLAAAQQRADPLPPRSRRRLLRGLVEPCCAMGRMEALARLAQAEGLLASPDEPSASAWEESTALPFDLAMGRYREVAARLDQLATLRLGWPITPAIGWTVAQVADFAPALDGRRPGLAEQQVILWAWLRYLASLGDYWSRSPCAALIGAMARVLARPERLPPDLRRALVRGALRLWGLSPRFWDMLAAEGATDLPGDLAEARALCAALAAQVQAETPDRARVDTLLSRAQALGMAEALRFRRELLGPSSLPGGRPDPEAAAARGLDPDETSLRALAHPEAPPADTLATEALREAAGRGLVAAYRQVPPAPLAALERRVLTQARALLARPQPEALAAWADSLLPLSGPDQHQAGIRLALGLAAGLARQGQAEAARALLDTPLFAPAPSLASSLAPPLAGTAQALGLLARHAPDLAAGAGAALGLAPAERRADPLADTGNPLHDTLVAVYSCRPYLDSRVAALRAGWLADLTAMGIPWLVFTGDGDGRRVGDTVHLDAPDDYEGLPDKSLALVRWVLDNTGFARLLKVDDDCHLQADAWFGDLAHLKHDYLGRPLTRVPGQLDRIWHMAKSRSQRGRLDLDKSPEPSRYADGGSGYMLSRPAMAALVEAAESPEGLRLRQLSFLEDKLVGDLLAQWQIAVSGEGYRTAVWRRTSPGRPLVPAWENGFLPWKDSPVKLAHLDDASQLARVHAASRAPLPRAGKIWPSFQPALCGSRTNTLDLLSPPERLARAREAKVAVVACLRNEARILPLFLDHYRRLGVEAFLIADNGSDDGTLELLMDAPDVALFAVDTEYGQSHYGVAWQQALLAGFRLGRWSLVADADEFLVWSHDPAARLPDLLAGPAFAQADAARVLMLDMYPRGPLSAVTLASGDPFAETGFVDRAPFLRASVSRGPFSDAETLTSALRHRLIPGARPELFVAQKYALLRYRPWMRLTAGLHYIAEARPAAQDLIFAHFKYTAAFRAKALAEVQRRQHFNDAEEYRKYLALISEGREVLYDPAISVPWRDCPEVARVFAAAR